MIASKLLKLKSVLYALLICTSAFSQDLSKEDAINDLVYLKSQIEHYQPGLEKYAPNFSSDAETMIDNVSEDSLSYFKFYEYLHRFCVLSKEGHFSIGNWFDTVRKGIPLNEYAYFPADIKVLNGKLYLEEDYSDEQSLQQGAEILRINGKLAGQILQKLYFTIPTDGAILTNADDELDVVFPYSYYFFIEQTAFFGITIRNISGRDTTVSVKALTRNEQRLNFTKQAKTLRLDKEAVNPVYSLKFEANYARLTLRSFNNGKLDDQKIKPKKLYKSIFKTIREKNVDNLVIDLRGNSGGLFTMAQELMPYVMLENPEDPFQRKSISWSGKERIYKFRKKRKKAFDGQIYVLINGGTFSSASTLARYLKEHSNAILIGEESGSRYEGFVAGSKQYITLPNSKLEVGIPRYLIEFGEGKKQQTTNRGVLPHHTINYSILHVINNRDLHMEKALELIKLKEE